MVQQVVKFSPELRHRAQLKWISLNDLRQVTLIRAKSSTRSSRSNHRPDVYKGEEEEPQKKS